ncbi:hypothetical protein A2U01_0089843, partial [Trifolium medium]|nr:hypothetical protein [Trifolium medium]
YCVVAIPLVVTDRGHSSNDAWTATQSGGFGGIDNDTLDGN